MTIKRGDIFYIDIPEDKNDPHKQTGLRPCVITSNDANNKYCERVHYIPLTTQLKKIDQPTHVILTSTDCLKYESMALCEGLESINKVFVKSKVGRASDMDMQRIDMGIDNQLGNTITLIYNPRVARYAYA
jgi:mRNA interferase MazF